MTSHMIPRLCCAYICVTHNNNTWRKWYSHVCEYMFHRTLLLLLLLRRRCCAITTFQIRMHMLNTGAILRHAIPLSNCCFTFHMFYDVNKLNLHSIFRWEWPVLGKIRYVHAYGRWLQRAHRHHYSTACGHCVSTRESGHIVMPFAQLNAILYLRRWNEQRIWVCDVNNIFIFVFTLTSISYSCTNNWVCLYIKELL